jgi:hypothetical protein
MVRDVIRAGDRMNGQGLKLDVWCGHRHCTMWLRPALLAVGCQGEEEGKGTVPCGPDLACWRSVKDRCSAGAVHIHQVVVGRPLKVG